ncbi:MAG: hypothetical protein K2X50_01940 [Gammaproteobacteria bacterium]|nr:hypothetical protein [Gammaproteobacteria bacterium]
MSMDQCPRCGELEIIDVGGGYQCNSCASAFYTFNCQQCQKEFIIYERPIDGKLRCEDCRIINAENLRNRIQKNGPDYNICKNSSYFTNGITDEYPISYRLVLLNIIFIFFQKSDISEFNTLKQDMSDLLEAIENKTEFQINYPSYFQIYTFKNIRSEDPKDIYALLIDKTRGTTPLFFYCNSSTTEKKRYRVEAFHSSLKEIISKFDTLIEIFTNNEIFFRENTTNNLLDNPNFKNHLCFILEQLANEED